MIDILVYLFENFHNFSLPTQPEALARKLSAIGFEKGDISIALGWLSGLSNARITEFECNPNSQRIYLDEEKKKLGIEGQSFIFFLENIGVITPMVRELIIEHAMMLKDDYVPIEKFKVIVLMVLWSRNQDIEQLIVEELLYGTAPELLH
jgi:Smg protein